MRIPLTCLLAGLACGCGGSRLAELEEEQHELRTSYDDLEANVTHLRNEMVSLGLVSERQSKARAIKGAAPAKGKARKRSPGFPKPDQELSEAYPWTAKRTGTPSALPESGVPERTDSACGWKLYLEHLQPISDFPLNRDGFGKSSPVVMFENDQPLTPHAMPEEFGDTCSGAFRHAGYLFLFSPNGAVDDAAARTYRLALSEEFPLPRGDDGRPMYWVYPGTTATFAFTGDWDENWGEARLALTGRVMMAQNGSATITGAGVDRALDTAGNLVVNEVIAPTAGGFELSIASPDGGPFVLVDSFTLGNADNAVVISAEAAWAARNE